MKYYNNIYCFDDEILGFDNEGERVLEFEFRFFCGQFSRFNYIFFYYEFKVFCYFSLIKRKKDEVMEKNKKKYLKKVREMYYILESLLNRELE